MFIAKAEKEQAMESVAIPSDSDCLQCHAGEGRKHEWEILTRSNSPPPPCSRMAATRPPASRPLPAALPRDVVVLPKAGAQLPRRGRRRALPPRRQHNARRHHILPSSLVLHLPRGRRVPSFIRRLALPRRSRSVAGVRPGLPHSWSPRRAPAAAAAAAPPPPCLWPQEEEEAASPRR